MTPKSARIIPLPPVLLITMILLGLCGVNCQPPPPSPALPLTNPNPIESSRFTDPWMNPALVEHTYTVHATYKYYSLSKVEAWSDTNNFSGFALTFTPDSVTNDGTPIATPPAG